uniref:Uncharacterized protein n=1 Tax=Medicago truncatula TaxID=3880 RepID=I3SH93_MEDTR|nr:unknown [Medicago truncatula]
MMKRCSLLIPRYLMD